MTPSKDAVSLDRIQEEVWAARLPLEIRLSPSESRQYDKTETYLISVPRLSYLPALLARLQTFYADLLIIDPVEGEPNGYFTHDHVPLKPHLPIGLLYDIHVLSTSDVDPKHKIKADSFQLTVHFSVTTLTDSSTTPIIPVLSRSQLSLHDAFINSTKEADFLRSGTAKPIMSLSAAESQSLWTATIANDLPTFAKIFATLLPGAGTSSTQMAWRYIPLRLYLPAMMESAAEDAGLNSVNDENVQATSRTQIRVLQAQVTPYVASASSTNTSTHAAHLRGQVSNIPQTIGMALHALLPSLFPSRRSPILAKPLLHGAVVPMNASLEELASKACYADGWVNVVVAVTG